MNRSPTKPVLLVALGGNTFMRKGQVGTAEEQFRNLAVPIRQIAALSEHYRLIITHGNGPQVGNLLLQEESCNAVPKLPLELIVAQTQGQMGYMIESALDGALMALGHSTDRHFVSLISYVVVDPDDPAFSAPSKPVGPAFSQEQAMALPYPTQRTARGYRRVVASHAGRLAGGEVLEEISGMGLVGHRRSSAICTLAHKIALLRFSN